MQSYKLAGTKDSENRGILGDAGREMGTGRLLLEAEIQKETEKEES